MIIDLRGIQALQQVRHELQESAGLDFPESCLKEMLLLYDICKKFDMPITYTREVLGARAYQLVTEYINTPLGFVPAGVKQVA